jgi:hypothetical protein
MADSDDPIEEELEEEPLDDDDPNVADVPEPDPTAPASDPEVESIEALIAKKENQADDDPLLALSREEKLETLAVKVVPPQESEFVCKRCFLVKHQSQLKDKKRTLCRDCA